MSQPAPHGDAAAPPAATPAPAPAPAPALEGCTDFRSACTAVVDHLAASGALMPSVYLARGDRLRCMAVRGYWQIFDGFPGTAGVIGHTVTTGTRSFVHGGASEHYLAAQVGVANELCVPLRVEGEVVGALNAESLRPMTDAEQADVDRCATLLEQALSRLPLPVESATQRLGRLAAELATLAGASSSSALHRAVVEGAREISGLDTAVLFLADDGRLTGRAATGPLSAALVGLTPNALAEAAQWAAPGTSSYSVGDDSALCTPGQLELRAAGVDSMVVLPLHLAAERLGVLLIASGNRRDMHPEDVELLEVLAGQVTSCLQVGAAVRDLREQASRDPLTGLGHHATFYAALAASRAVTRPGRTAVLYLDVDHFKTVNDDRGHAEGDQLLRDVTACMGNALRHGDELFRIGGDEFAALLPVADESEAVAVGERLLSAVRRELGVGLSAGVAVDLDGEDDEALVARADAALYRAKDAGRGRLHLVTASAALATHVPGQRPETAAP